MSRSAAPCPAIHELPDKDGHRSAPAGTSAEAEYAPAHEVRIVPGGVLEGIVGAGPVRVNSVHDQGADRLAAGARAEALAPDGLVEALSMPAATSFNLCLQWHPEWKAAENPVSMKLLRAFGDACRRGFGSAPRARARFRTARLRARFTARRRSPRHAAKAAGKSIQRQMIVDKSTFTFAELEQWLDERRVTEIECLVPNLTGVARGGEE